MELTVEWINEAADQPRIADDPPCLSIFFTEPR
jgi:hypothetical protein